MSRSLPPPKAPAPPDAPPLQPQQPSVASFDYRGILDHTTDAVIISSADGFIVDVNAGACRLLGYRREELIGRPGSEIVAEAGRSSTPRLLEELRRTGTLRVDRQYLRRDGSTVTVEATSAVIPPNHFLTIARDATDRIRVEQELRRQADLVDGQNRVLEMIAGAEPLDRTLAAVVDVIDAQHPETIASILLADDSGRRLIAKVGPRLPSDFRAAIAEVEIGPNVGSCGTAAFLCKPVYVSDIATDPKWAGGRELALSNGLRACWSSPVLARTGEVLGTFALYFRRPAEPDAFQLRLIDVAARLVALAVEQDRARAALVRTNAALRAVVDNAPVAIMVVGADRRISSWNPAAERIFGYTAVEAIGRTVPDLMVPVDRAEEHDAFWRRAATGELLNGIEFHRRRKDGTPLDVSIWTSPLRAPDGSTSGVLAFCADVTQQARLQEQLLRAQRMESIGRLAGGISHEFNNLLAVISGYSESLLRRTDPGHPLRDHAEEIHRAASRGAALTQQLLAFSRRQRTAPRVMDLSLAVHGTYSMLRRLISDKIEIALHAETPILVKADPGQIEQVLVNLTINARDAMPPTGGKISIVTEHVDLAAGDVQGLDPGPYAQLSVCDSGYGMAPETCARIFEPFFTTKEHGNGTGLGLSVVYGIVQHAGGHIAVRSAVGQGSQFDILFPIAPVATSPAVS